MMITPGGHHYTGMLRVDLVPLWLFTLLIQVASGKKYEYGGVYGELYRRYRIPSYRELPAAKYDDAIKWLAAWFHDLTGEEPF